MAVCEVILQGVDGGGKKSALRHAWVYWKEQGKLRLLRSDGAGRLFALAPDPKLDRSHWWEYFDRFTTTVDAAVDVCVSRGAKPVPEALLPAAAFVKTKAALPAGAAAQLAKLSPNAANKLVSIPTALIDLDDVPATLTAPAELTLWPLTWAPHPDDYPTAGISQGSALFTGTGASTVTNFPTAINAPADRIPRERSLRISGTIDPRATALSLRVADGAGNAIALQDASGTAAPADRCGGQRWKIHRGSVLRLAGGCVGPVVIVGELTAAGKTFVEGFRRAPLRAAAWAGRRFRRQPRWHAARAGACRAAHRRFPQIGFRRLPNHWPARGRGGWWSTRCPSARVLEARRRSRSFLCGWRRCSSWESARAGFAS